MKHQYRDKGLELLKQAATSRVSNFNQILACVLVRQEGASIGSRRDEE